MLSPKLAQRIITEAGLMLLAEQPTITFYDPKDPAGPRVAVPNPAYIDLFGTSDGACILAIHKILQSVLSPAAQAALVNAIVNAANDLAAEPSEDPKEVKG